MIWMIDLTEKSGNLPVDVEIWECFRYRIDQNRPLFNPSIPSLGGIAAARYWAPALHWSSTCGRAMGLPARDCVLNLASCRSHVAIYLIPHEDWHPSHRCHLYRQTTASVR